MFLVQSNKIPELGLPVVNCDPIGPDIDNLAHTDDNFTYYMYLL